MCMPMAVDIYKWIPITNIRNPKKNPKKKRSAAEKVMYTQLPNIYNKGVNNYTNDANDDLPTPSL